MLSALLVSCGVNGTGPARWGSDGHAVPVMPVRFSASGEGAAKVRLQLAEQRSAFMKTRDPDLVFAVFYYHVTVGILAKIREGGLCHPEYWLDEVVAFHADYARNVDPRSREAHWRPYHQRAADLRGRVFRGWQVASPADFIVPCSLTATGVSAHIGTDLPRSLLMVGARHPKLGMEPGGGLERDFRELSGVFYGASRLGFEDLRTAFGPVPTWYLGAIPGRDRIAAWWIGILREKAWKDTYSPTSATSPGRMKGRSLRRWQGGSGTR